jgi:hypothetical protein
MKELLVKCGIDAMEKKLECKYEHCNYASNKKANLKRHAKRHAKESGPILRGGSSSSPSGTWARFGANIFCG